MGRFGTFPSSIQESSDSVKVPILKAAELGERWPVLLWFYLKTLGLYHSGNYDNNSTLASILFYNLCISGHLNSGQLSQHVHYAHYNMDLPLVDTVKINCVLPEKIQSCSVHVYRLGLNSTDLESSNSGLNIIFKGQYPPDCVLIYE